MNISSPRMLLPGRVAAKAGLGTALILTVGAVVALIAAAPHAAASTADSWMLVDKASQTACLKAANLKEATAGPPVRYSDKLMIDARVVSGTWPQAHMKWAKATLLCLYHRRSKRVEVQELALPVPPAPPVMISDVWWQAEAIGGNAVVANSEVTLMLGSDGKAGGKSGCNGYGASYQLDGGNLRLMPPMIGTMMACSPALMAQEQAYRNLLERAVSAKVTADGRLEVMSADGQTILYAKK